jgi:hypothetical protein
MRGAGRVTFVAVLLFLAGAINIVYGFGAIDGARVFVGELTGGVSLMSGAAYGRVIGIIAGSLGAIGALLSIGGRYPWWSLAVFFLCIYIVHGISMYGEDETATDEVRAARG